MTSIGQLVIIWSFVIITRGYLPIISIRRIFIKF